MIVRDAEADVSTQCPDLMILIVDPSTWSMDGVILICACETVTDGKITKIQKIVRDAEADATTQCPDVIMDPSTCSMATSTERTVLDVSMARGVMKCA